MLNIIFNSTCYNCMADVWQHLDLGATDVEKGSAIKIYCTEL